MPLSTGSEQKLPGSADTGIELGNLSPTNRSRANSERFKSDAVEITQKLSEYITNAKKAETGDKLESAIDKFPQNLHLSSGTTIKINSLMEQNHRLHNAVPTDFSEQLSDLKKKLDLYHKVATVLRSVNNTVNNTEKTKSISVLKDALNLLEKPIDDKSIERHLPILEIGQSEYSSLKSSLSSMIEEHGRQEATRIAVAQKSICDQQEATRIAAAKKSICDQIDNIFKAFNKEVCEEAGKYNPKAQGVALEFLGKIMVVKAFFLDKIINLSEQDSKEIDTLLEDLSSECVKIANNQPSEFKKDLNLFDRVNNFIVGIRNKIKETFKFDFLIPLEEKKSKASNAFGMFADKISKVEKHNSTPPKSTPGTKLSN